MLEGVIIKNISNNYTVLCDDNRYECTPRGKFRKEKKIPLVGDRCVIDRENHYIMELKSRKNCLDRPTVCNVDYALIVTSMKHPEFSSFLLDKEISSMILAHIKPVILFTKDDLLEEKEKKEFLSIKEYYKRIGIPCFFKDEKEQLLELLQGKFVVLTGQTGAGKSTFLNRLNPNLNLKTDEISEALNRGKHTTRHTEIFEIDGVYFFDTPGFSSLELEKYTKEEIRDSFVEFDSPCQFRDCMHLKELGCSVKQRLEEGSLLKSRYESYVKMLERKKK